MRFSLIFAAVVASSTAMGTSSSGTSRLDDYAQNTDARPITSVPQASTSNFTNSRVVPGSFSAPVNASAPTAVNASAPAAVNASVPAAVNASARAAVNASVPAAVNASALPAVNASVPAGVNASALPAVNASALPAVNASVPSAVNASMASAVNASAPAAVNASVPPAVNVSAPAAVNVSAPAAVNASAPVVTPAATTNTTSGTQVPAGQIASAATVVPKPVNASMVSNASAGIPPPISAQALKGMNVSTNVPEFTNISTVSQSPGNTTNFLQATGIPPGPSTQQESCPQETSSQQNAANAEAMAELMKNLEMLTGIYTRIPRTFGFLSDAEEKAPQNESYGIQNPLGKFNMCMLTSKVGDERGPVTVLVAAEDEQRMRAPKSYYQVGNVFPEKQRAFTSYCPGRDILFLTFEPKKNR